MYLSLYLSVAELLALGYVIDHAYMNNNKIFVRGCTLGVGH